MRTSAQRVLQATNSWLHSQTRSQYAYDRDRGYVCTLSAIVIKSTTAHLFHVGDSRIYRVTGNTLEQLTDDHRVIINSQQSYLGRALGVNPQIEIDYQMLPVEPGDIFVLVDRRHLRASQRAPDRQGRQRRAPPISMRPRGAIVEQAYRRRQRGQSHGPDRARRELPDERGQRSVRPAERAAAAAAAGSADDVRRLSHRARAAWLEPQPHLSRRRHRDRCGRHPQDALDRSARRSGLSEALHDGGVGGAADRQPACAETVPAVAQAQLPLSSSPNTSTARR